MMIRSAVIVKPIDIESLVDLLIVPFDELFDNLVTKMLIARASIQALEEACESFHARFV